MPYPTARPVKIKINGTDRTASIPVDSASASAIGGRPLTIEDQNRTKTASLTVKNGGALGLAGLQTVIISDVAETVRYFGGVITGLLDHSRGPFLDYNVDCEDFGWYLDHPEALIDAEYTGNSDQTIIQAFMATCCPDIEVATHVDVVLANIDYIRFENETPYAALTRLAKMAGAEFYVDYGDVLHPKGHLHYFASGTNAAPHGLSDACADPPVDPYPYDEFHKVDRVPDVNSVEVVGRNQSVDCFTGTVQDTEQGNSPTYNLSNGNKVIDDEAPPVAQDFNDWKTVAGDAAYMIVVKWSEFQAWGYLGNVVDANTIKVYKDIGLTQGGLNGHSIVAPTVLDSYNIYTADGDYGYWIKSKIVDNDLITTEDLLQRGDQFLADVAAGVSYTCITWEPGLESGQNVTVVNAARSLNSSLFIKRVMTTFDTGGYAEFALEMGAYIRRLGDVLAGGRNIWDEDKFLPKHPGTVEMEDAGTDVQSTLNLTTYNDQADMPSTIELEKSHSDILSDVVDTVDDEELGSIEWYGATGFVPHVIGAITRVIQDGVPAAYIPSEYEIITYNDAGPNEPVTVDSAGNLAIHGQQELRFYDDGNYVGFEAPALVADQIWVLPAVDGNANECLVTDGAGNLSWAANTAGGAGTDNHLVRWDVGNAIQDSGIIVDDSGNMVTPGTIELDFASGDPIVIFDTDAADRWALGVDDDDLLYKFKLDAGGALGGYADFELSAGGQQELIGGGTDGYAALSLSTYCDQAELSSLITFFKSNSDTLGTLAATQDGQGLAAMIVYGVGSGAAPALAGVWQVIQEGSAGADYIPSRMYLANSTDDGMCGGLILTPEDRAGIGMADVYADVPGGQLHVEQKQSLGAIPVLVLEQIDQDDVFINFIGTSAADQTQSISTVNGDGVVTGPKDYSAQAGWHFVGMFRIEINGTVRWLPYYQPDTGE